MKMKKLRVFTIFAAFLIMISPVMTVMASESNYTYNYDYWFEQVASPDAYYVTAYLMGKDFGIENFNDAQGLFICENRIYICDSGNNRIVILEYKAETGEYELKKVISSVMIDGAESNFNYPTDLFETKSGEFYICDKKNERVLHLDKDWNYINELTHPNDESFDTANQFLPNKLVVDKAERVYIQATNINKGLMEYDSRGQFTGYMGANEVTVSMYDYLVKLFSTKAQRAQMELFVPTEYSNVCIDYDGFMYTTTNTFDENEIYDAKPIRRLNAMGKDILVRNGYDDPIGDESWDTAGGISGSSRFVDVVAFDNDSYCCLDRTRSRLFMYDFQGNLLYAFSSIGNKEGYFLFPTAIDEMGYSIFVLDAKTGALTRMDLTEYGYYINEGLKNYKRGHYEESAQAWEQVLKINGNYDLAYIGIGRAALRQGDYKKAMDYFKAKRSAENYGKAFQLYRKQWMEDNIGRILVVIVILIIVPKVFRLVKKIRKEVAEE